MRPASERKELSIPADISAFVRDKAPSIEVLVNEKIRDFIKSDV